MNLRDQLKEILPDILPRNPAQSIKGTELIELVKYRLKQEYSDATLRYHFSIMSCDPSSPIAKVEQGQGYYLRSTTIHSLNSARSILSDGQATLGGEFGMSSQDADIALGRANKFRAVVQRYCDSIQRFPFAFERSFSLEEAGANRWRFPDMAVVEWLVGDVVDENYSLDASKLELHQKLGKNPLKVSSLKLRLEVSHASLREDLFQCLATSEWANSGEIMIAAPIDDEQLMEEMRQFSANYGVGVTTFGLSGDILDDMPEPAAILSLLPREFEAIQSLFSLRRIASAAERSEFDWQHVVSAGALNEDFASFNDWISDSILSGKATSARDFADLQGDKEQVA